MGIIAGLLTFLGGIAPFVLKLFGYAPKNAVKSPEERLGGEETENASLKDYISTEKAADGAVSRVVDDPRVVFNDPDNRRERPPGPSA